MLFLEEVFNESGKANPEMPKHDAYRRDRFLRKRHLNLIKAI
jgi:hypothetical protein